MAQVTTTDEIYEDLCKFLALWKNQDNYSDQIAKLDSPSISNHILASYKNELVNKYRAYEPMSDTIDKIEQALRDFRVEKRNSNPLNYMHFCANDEEQIGLVRIAQSMVEPIKKMIEEKSLARSIFSVEDLPQGAMSRYYQPRHAKGLAVIDFDNAIVRELKQAFAWWVGRPIESKDENYKVVEVPMCEIVHEVKTELEEPECWNQYHIEDMQRESANKMSHIENENFISLLESSENINNTTNTKEFNSEIIDRCIRHFIAKELPAGAILTNNEVVWDCMRSMSGFQRSDIQTYLTTNLAGTYTHGNITIPVYKHKSCNINTMYFFPEADFCGSIPVRQDLTVLPTTQGKNKTEVGFIVFQEIGMAIIDIDDMVCLRENNE